MADKISGFGGGGVDITSTRSRSTARTERGSDGDKAQAARRPAEPSSAASSAASQIRLTDTATNLKQIEARVKDLPDVDRARVDALRQRIESGAYEINAGRLADRLLAFERDLA